MSPTLIKDKEGFIINTKTGDRLVFYDCDPNKNVLCPKTMCGLTNADGFGCTRTCEPLFAKEGGDHYHIQQLPDGSTVDHVIEGW